MKKLFLLSILIGFISCKKEPKQQQVYKPQKNETYSLNYAKGFSITDNGNFNVLTIKNPWPKSEKNYKYALVNKELLPKITLNAEEFDGIISIPVEKIVVTSTTHLPALELLGVEQTIVGFPGTDYISSKSIRKLITESKIRELGKN